MFESMNILESININELITTYLIPWGKNIILAVIIFILGRYIANLLNGLVRKVLTNAKVDTILINFLSSIVAWILLLIVIIMALNQLGINTTSLIALIGAAGLAIGLSLQDSLKNFAAGVMLITFRPFREGDYVDAGGTSGSVENIAIFSTTFKTPDNRQVVVPNGAIYSGVITNYSAMDTRRIDMVFGIGYDDDIKKAKEIIENILKSEGRIHSLPAPVVAVDELADSSVNFVVRPWVNTSDYWAVKWELTEKIKIAFDENGISIPFPQMDVHLDKEEPQQEQPGEIRDTGSGGENS
ncbi:MAG: mechanosensitive ion channel [Deltaproteobacteria bacterium]